MVSIKISGKPFRLACIYRPPKHPSTLFIDEFCSFLEDNCLAGDPILLMRDFNIHVDIPNYPFAKKINEVLYAFGLKQHITDSTHSKGHTIDLIISRSNDDPKIDSIYIGDLISDHRAVHCRFNLDKPKRILNEKQYRKIKAIDLDEFKADIQNSKLVKDFQDYKLDDLVELYDTELLAILNKHAPIIHRKSSNPKREPWYDNNIQAARRDLRRYERIWSKTNSLKDKDKFLFQKDRFEDLLEKAQSEYYANLIDENKHDQGALYKAINKVMHRVKDNPLPKSDSPEELANDFNENFNTKIENIR